MDIDRSVKLKDAGLIKNAKDPIRIRMICDSFHWIFFVSM